MSLEYLMRFEYIRFYGPITPPVEVDTYIRGDTTADDSGDLFISRDAFAQTFSPYESLRGKDCYDLRSRQSIRDSIQDCNVIE